jgi:hypothetical protein
LPAGLLGILKLEAYLNIAAWKINYMEKSGRDVILRAGGTLRGNSRIGEKLIDHYCSHEREEEHDNPSESKQYPMDRFELHAGNAGMKSAIPKSFMVPAS